MSKKLQVELNRLKCKLVYQKHNQLEMLLRLVSYFCIKQFSKFIVNFHGKNSAQTQINEINLLIFHIFCYKLMSNYS